MKKLIYIMLLFLAVGCYSNIYSDDEVSDELFDCQEGDAQERFAKALSSYLYESFDVRAFLREKALEQFDNDFDIFYPYIKDEVMPNGLSFRENILRYFESEQELSSIEDCLPLLTIYVPDLTWISQDAFSANNWEINNPEVATAYECGSILFLNGEEVAILSEGEIPSEPTLIVKNNERLQRKLTTKGANEYSFISPVFDNSLEPITKADPPSEHVIELPVEGDGNFVPEHMVSNIAKESWNYLGSLQTASQRDYAYYGMTQNNPIGHLNVYTRELLYRFKIAPSSYFSIADQNVGTSSGDPSLSDDITVKTDSLSVNELVNRIWKEGHFELYFDEYVGLRSGEVSSSQLVFTVNPEDIFDLSCVDVDFYHKTWFTKRRWVYSFNASNLRAKWYYPENATIIPWDLYNQSNNVVIFVSERDDSQTTTTTYSRTFKISQTCTQTTGATGEVQIIKGSFENANTVSNEISNTSSCSISTTTGSDALGSINLRYMDPVIVGEDTINGIHGYNLFSVSSGSVTMCFMPYRY
ncbi:MAG: hypothetical protein MJY73_01950 [Bacteroidales bacterium]|nr:hypothetical protein [Bacteroidales bacterium]